MHSRHAQDVTYARRGVARTEVGFHSFIIPQQNRGDNGIFVTCDTRQRKLPGKVLLQLIRLGPQPVHIATVNLLPMPRRHIAREIDTFAMHIAPVIKRIGILGRLNVFYLTVNQYSITISKLCGR